jgi:hypothetical protein
LVDEQWAAIHMVEEEGGHPLGKRGVGGPFFFSPSASSSSFVPFFLPFLVLVSVSLV